MRLLCSDKEISPVETIFTEKLSRHLNSLKYVLLDIYLAYLP